MWRMCLSVLVSGWIFTGPALWVHRPEQAVLSVLIGMAAMIVSFAAVVRPRLGAVVFALGAARAISTFVFPDSFGSNTDSLTTGLLLVIAGMYPRMQVIPAVVAKPARRPERERTERLAA